MNTKVRCLLATLWVIALSSESRAQTGPVSVTVIYAEGEISYRPSANSPWQPLTNGLQAVVLPTAFEIKLVRQAKLAVGNPHRTPVLIRNRDGVFRLSALLRAPTPSDEVADVAGQYFTYLWRNLRHRHETIDTYAQAHMKRKGVVSRGDSCATPLMVIPDYGAAISTDTVLHFSWHPDASAVRYNVALYDAPGPNANVLHTAETTDTTYRFVLDKPFLEKGVTYYWSVFPVGKPTCARFTFTFPKTEKLRQLETQIDKLEHQLSTDATLMTFLKAALYEQNRYYPEAYRSYAQAHRLSPTNALYRDGFALFLARRGLTQQAKKLYAGN